METMTELKRKREDVDDGKPDDKGAGTTDVALGQAVHPSSSSSSSSTSSQSPPPLPTAQMQPCSSEVEGEDRSHGDSPAASTGVASVAADKTDKPAASAAADRQTILICGKEVALQSTMGRKRRKHTLETLVILAYKSRLAIACKANDMMAALEIHREMKNKGVKQDLSVRLGFSTVRT